MPNIPTLLTRTAFVTRGYLGVREEHIDSPSRFAHGDRSTARHRVILQFAADITARAFDGDRLLVRQGSRRIAKESIGLGGRLMGAAGWEKSLREFLLLSA